MLAAEPEEANNPTHSSGSADPGFAATAARLAPERETAGREGANLGSTATGQAIAREDVAGGAVAEQAVPEATSVNSAVAARARQPLRILLVEDDPTDIELSLCTLQRAGFDTDSSAVQTADEFLERVRHTDYDVILADYNLPSWNGMETVEALRREGLDIPVIIVSGYLGELKAVDCIKLGAADYVLKDTLLRLPDCVRRALRESKLREENRRSQEDLARSNRDLEQFAYVASHDLQEPLRMVAAYTQLLSERYKGKLDENADKYIHYAVDGATRMQTLVKDLLAFSRVGRQGREAQLTECSTLVNRALKNLQAAIQESGARVEYADLPSIVADASLLTQVFQNLIGNAIKFRGTEPIVVRITAEKTKQETIFSIADNGIGIASEHSELIFAIFKRLHTREEYPGSGIGLSICKKVIEQHGGRIWVESEPGHGCTFRFTLPNQGAEDAKASQSPNKENPEENQ
jgi:signal transduction histidine kinase